VLRSMKRAIYSAEKIGHFGLAKDYYAHFTSPIRRYPDLVLHRQLADFLDGKGGKLPQSYLVQTAFLATEREQVADDASRQLVEIKKFRFLQQQIDEKKLIEYRAVVAKCTNYGVFIDIPDLAMGGMIHISNLSKQFVRFNPANESLSAGSEIYRVGTVLKVHVATVDFNQRRADYVLAGVEEPRPEGRGRKTEDRGQRAESGGRKSAAGNRQPDERGRKPKAGGQRPDSRGPKPAGGAHKAGGRGPKPAGTPQGSRPEGQGRKPQVESGARPPSKHRRPR